MVKIPIELNQSDWEIICLALQERAMEKYRSCTLTKDQHQMEAFIKDSKKAEFICNIIATDAKLNPVFMATEEL